MSDLTNLIGDVDASGDQKVETPENPQGMRDFLRNDAPELKPDNFKIDPVKWMHTVRTALRGGNLMAVGPSGCGKTMLIMELAKALNRPFFYFNLGSTQDPRTTLVGSREAEDGSTYFNESPFVEAIQTEDAIVLLDEISRAHIEAWNILLTVLDPKQRYLQLDEATDQEVIQVADGVCFASTANIGTQYTGTRELDRALTDRFTTIEMEPLEEDEELDLLKQLFDSVDNDKLESIAGIAAETRREAKSQNPAVDRIISTRQSVQMAEQIRDGYTILDALAVTVYPNYEDTGGSRSPRGYIKKIVQGRVDEQDVDDYIFGNDDIQFSRQVFS